MSGSGLRQMELVDAQGGGLGSEGSEGWEGSEGSEGSERWVELRPNSAWLSNQQPLGWRCAAVGDQSKLLKQPWSCSLVLWSAL